MRFLVLLAFLATAHARAVNISNTWVLPEEGFPVFYRYFRDRISWYEADAVCQFHHANLVTVDTTAQYDAVRAYLRELDISSAVWVGLIRSNPEGDFTWTDYRGLTGDGYWSSAPDPRAAPLCAAADPTADYRWEARACGGPTVASFICELPVPQWALGKEGCMVRALPALTILYLPESAAVQLTADCGLAGVKRLQCTGNVKREDLLRDLSCTEEVESSSSLNNISTLNSSTTADVTTITENLEITNVITAEENLTMDHDNFSVAVVSTPIPSEAINIKPIISITPPTISYINNVVGDKRVNLNIMENNNLQSNDIPNLVNNNDFLTDYKIQKMEDEDNIQHKKLHEELARLGNFETIFTQPTDHFVPPLVIAKARLNDDMTVLSLEEKHAQHFGSHKMFKHSKGQSVLLNANAKFAISTEHPVVIDNIGSTEITEILKDEFKKDKLKIITPKKYIFKGSDSKNSNILKNKIKNPNPNIIKDISNKINSKVVSNHLDLTENVTEQTSTTQGRGENQNDAYIDLTVSLRDPSHQKNLTAETDNAMNLTNTESEDKIMSINIATNESIPQNLTIKINKVNNAEQIILKNYTLNSTLIMDDTISGSTLNESKNFDDFLTILDITTKIPTFKDDIINSSNSEMNSRSDVTNVTQIKDTRFTTEGIQNGDVSLYSMPLAFSTEITRAPLNKGENLDVHLETATSIFVSNYSNASNSYDHNFYSTYDPKINDAFNVTENTEEVGNNSGDLETIDDFQSPLLSAANEPLQRPIRSRRPKQLPSRINKFNPFRILG